MTSSNWKIIAETRSNIFRGWPRCRRRRSNVPFERTYLNRWKRKDLSLWSHSNSQNSHKYDACLNIIVSRTAFAHILDKLPVSFSSKYTVIQMNGIKTAQGQKLYLENRQTSLIVTSIQLLREARRQVKFVKQIKWAIWGVWVPGSDN